MPTISVIIPTHNRSASIKRTLDTLSTQTYPFQEMEVIVVADGCTDGTAEALRAYTAPFDLQVIEQPPQGAATARNRGVAQARGSLLVFLDDDIEAAPQLVEAYVQIHQKQPNSVVIGYLPPVHHSKANFFDSRLRLWWEDTFQAMRQPGYRFSYCNLFSGNFSLPTALFNQVGGFDTAFVLGNEDYELGVRLIKADANFSFSPDAWGYHHDRSDFERIQRRKYQEGLTNVQLGRKHPDLISVLPFATLIESHQSLFFQVLLFFIFQFPALTDLLVVWLRQLLDVLEWIRAWGYWKMLQDILFGYWYFRGVADAFNREQSMLTSFLQAKPTKTDLHKLEIELDLQEGLAAAEQILDKYRPTSARIHYGQQPVGYIPSKPGCERLRGVHLKPILATTLAVPLLQALALEGNTDVGFSRLSNDQQSTQITIPSPEKAYAH